MNQQDGETESPAVTVISAETKLSWRIYPPPNTHPRRTKKNREKKHSKQQQREQQSEGNHDEGRQQGHIEEKTELWRQKQHQYKYAYPYKDGDRVIVLTPQHHHQQQREQSRAETNPTESDPSNDERFRELKKRKCSAVNVGEGVSGKATDHNVMVPMPGIVVRASDEKTENQSGTTSGHTPIQIQCLNPGGSVQASTLDAVSAREQRKRLCPDLSAPTPIAGTSKQKTCSIVLVEETLPFRQVVRFQLHNHRVQKDKVLEIGCSTGELSKTIWKNHSMEPSSSSSGPSWIGIDLSQEMIDRCREQLDQHKSSHPSYASKVVRVDVLAEPKRALKEATSERFGPSPTVVLIDIGGNRECGPVIKTMAWVLDTFGGTEDLRMVIVKSRALVRQALSDCGNESEIFNSTSDSAHGSNTTNRVPTLNASNGILSGGTEWFKATKHKLLVAQQNRFDQRFKHPLKAPKVLSPADGTTPICRYHNYHRDGCKLHNDRVALGTHCPFDHEHCHACLQEGHVAKDCPNRGTQSCY